VQQRILLLIQFGHYGDKVAAGFEQLVLRLDVLQHHTYAQFLPSIEAQFAPAWSEVSARKVESTYPLNGEREL
jgi:hypothetical protein